MTDYVDLTDGYRQSAGFSSSTRAGIGGGRKYNSDSEALANNIEYITIASVGNAADFGDLTNRRSSQISLSNNTRALFGGGYDYAGAPAGSGTRKDIIDFITIQSLGDAVDFGNLQQAKLNMASVASTTRGVHST